MSKAIGERPLLTRLSPNHGERVAGPTDILLLHYTGMPHADQALAHLCDPQSSVSSHYFVHEDGTIVQMVDEDRRAWHAGAACWAGERDINSRSIGVEIANQGHAAVPEGVSPPPFPAVQIDAVIALCSDILSRHDIKPQRVLAHSDVAPGRKTDPGEAFPWSRLAASGIGHWVEPEPIRSGKFIAAGDTGQPVEALQSMLGLYGYELEISGQFDEITGQVVAAFQRHFRPLRVDGVADASTVQTLGNLIRNLP